MNQVIVSRVEGHSYRDIAKETGLSFATVARILKGVNLGNEAEVKEDPQGVAKESQQPEPINLLAEAIQPQQPQNYFLKPGLTAQEWAELSKKDKSSLLTMVGELRAQNSSLQASAVMRKPANGNGGEGAISTHNNGDSGESAFWNELARSEKIERALRIRDRYGTDKKTGEYPADVKQILEIFKVFAPKQASELEVYKQASEDTRKNLETLMKKEASNDFDVKLEELRQNREVDLKKIDWEIQKWRADRDEDGKKWELLSKAVEGPIASTIQNLGNATAQRLTRNKKNPQVTRISCPNCNGQTFIDSSSETAICGLCGSLLARQASPEPQSPTQEQPQTPEENKQAEEEAKNEVKTNALK